LESVKGVALTGSGGWGRYERRFTTFLQRGLIKQLGLIACNAAQQVRLRGATLSQVSIVNLVRVIAAMSRQRFSGEGPLPGRSIRTSNVVSPPRPPGA